MDYDGRRILANYYDQELFPTIKEQKAFEKNLFSKTHKANSEIIMLDGLTCLYRSNVDLYFFVIGSSHENPLLLMSLLNCVFDTANHIVLKNMEKRAVFDSLHLVMLALDEICDGGIILETDANAIMSRLVLRTEDIPLGEQTVAQVKKAIYAINTPFMCLTVSTQLNLH